MSRTVAVIGARGQLGSDLCRALESAGCKVVALTHDQIDVCDAARCREVLAAHRPDDVVNTAAFHRVDDCEAEPARAFEVNALAVRSLAQTCRDQGARLVQLSTDYVFGGEADRARPYEERDAAFPINVYGASKLAGEHFVLGSSPRHLVVRTSGLYGRAGSSGKGGNFVELMLRLAGQGQPIKVVADQVLAPTYTVDLAEGLVALLQGDHSGLYHVTSGGHTSWHDFARAIFELAGLTPDLTATTTEAFAARARRPAFSALSGSRLQASGLTPLRPWREALAAYLAARGA